jgi:hypothetical protein
MTDIRFQSFEDGELADIWYALGGAAVRHPDHFKPLMDSVATELLARRGVGLNPWLEERYRAFRLDDSRDDAYANQAISPETREPASEPVRR